LQVPEKEPQQRPLWKLRTKEEAQGFWEGEFGHLRADPGTPEGRPRQRTAKEREFVASQRGSGRQLPVLARAAPTPEDARMRPMAELDPLPYDASA
jgi:hypothetical protein